MNGASEILKRFEDRESKQDLKILKRFKNRESEQDYEKRKQLARPVSQKITREIINYFKQIFK